MVTPPLASFSSVYQFFAQGGFFMLLLLICSVVSVAMIIMRGLALRRNLVMPLEIEREVDGLRHDDAEGVVRLSRLVRNDSSSLGRVIQTALSHLTWPKTENVEAVQTRARHEIVRLETGLFVLEVIVGIAPLLGLLGAVAGLVKVFAAFGNNAAQSDPHIIARGISEALSTTIVGLAIAIPSLIAYSYFSKKIETMAAEMESLVADLLAKCYSQKNRRYSARITPADSYYESTSAYDDTL
ncbi:MotA/TolQ/ExbB proton channel family protein [Verrucomicrobiota bacterium sgz303538]